MAGDTGTAMAWIKLPYLQRTLSSEAIVETQEDLIDDVIKFGQTLKGQGATQLVRLVIDAEFLGENYISGSHMTHTLRDAKPVIESYATRMVLTRDAGAWKMLETDSMLNNLHWPAYIPRPRQDAANKIPPPAPINDARALTIEPKDLYQNFINALSDANNRNDFELYCSYLMFPYSSHSDVSDTVLRSSEEVRPFFDMLRETLAEKSCDHLVRHAQGAEFIASDLICGYHTTEFCAGDVTHFGPVRSRMMLQRIGEKWYLKSVTNSLENSEFPYHAPRPSSGLVTLRTIQERTRA